VRSTKACSADTGRDDCLAVNSGSGITFSNNYCSGGHGISIVSMLSDLLNTNLMAAQGSIKSDKVVSNVTISGNTVVDSTNGLRIK
jgi:polygalacturonase